jgi:hypothetical protein
MALRQLFRPLLQSPPHLVPPQPPSTSAAAFTTRRAAAAALVLLAAAARPAARAEVGGADVDEARVVRLFEVLLGLSSAAAFSQQWEPDPPSTSARRCDCVQEASPSVVFIKDLVVSGQQSRGSDGEGDVEEGGAKVEGTGSGFVWDSAGHIVSVFLLAFLSGPETSSKTLKLTLP